MSMWMGGTYHRRLARCRNRQASASSTPCAWPSLQTRVCHSSTVCPEYYHDDQWDMPQSQTCLLLLPCSKESDAQAAVQHRQAKLASRVKSFQTSLRQRFMLELDKSGNIHKHAPARCVIVPMSAVCNTDAAYACKPLLCESLKPSLLYQQPKKFQYFHDIADTGRLLAESASTTLLADSLHCNGERGAAKAL